jgi:hypothetical protein
MPEGFSNGKRRRFKQLGLARTIAASVCFMFTVVLLLIGFSGPSLDFVLAGRAGWVYIGAVIAVATAVFIKIFSADERRGTSRPRRPDRSKESK